MTAAERQRAAKLIVALRASLIEQAVTWKRVSDSFETAYRRKPTQRDIEMEVRQKMNGELPEILRLELALLGVSVPHE